MVTTSFLFRIADLMTVAWNVYGIKLITRSCLATSASRALSSVTSREIGRAVLTPSESFFALSRVLQATSRSVFISGSAFLGTDQQIPQFQHR